jgi:ribosomal-protein-alanine N-acetyltransferase
LLRCQERARIDIATEDDSPGTRRDSIAAVEVRGPSLSLRYAAAGDAPALLTLGSDPEVTRYFSWGPYTAVSQPAAYIAGLAGERERGERLDFLIVGQDDAPLGVIGLSEFSRRDRRAVVGTWLARAAWGTGVNRDAKALIAWLAFAVLGLERLGAYSDLENVRSQAALVRLGFVREGILRRWHRHGDHVHDVILYSWLREEWERSPLAHVHVQVSGPSPPAFSCAAAPS